MLSVTRKFMSFLTTTVIIKQNLFTLFFLYTFDSEYWARTLKKLGLDCSPKLQWGSNYRMTDIRITTPGDLNTGQTLNNYKICSGEL